MSNALFKTGGFLNEREYEMSIKNNSSYLAPGIGYWLVDRKILDVKAEAFANPNVESGVRVTEFTKHDVKVKNLIINIIFSSYYNYLSIITISY